MTVDKVSDPETQGANRVPVRVINDQLTVARRLNAEVNADLIAKFG